MLVNHRGWVGYGSMNSDRDDRAIGRSGGDGGSAATNAVKSGDLSVRSHVGSNFATYLQRRYAPALLIVAATVVASHLLMHRHLDRLDASGSAINFAGRQRMLSQRITKQALLIVDGRKQDADLETGIQEDAKEWATVQQGLMRGDRSRNIPRNTDPEIATLMVRNQRPHEIMLAAVESLLAGRSDDETRAAAMKNLLAAEGEYLETMDAVVFAMADNANRATVFQARTSWAMLIATLFILGMEAVFIFRPAVREIASSAERLHVINQRLEHALGRAILDMLSVCSFCKAVKDDDGEWRPLDEYLSETRDVVFSHGLCNDCLRKHYGDLFPEGELDELS